MANHTSRSGDSAEPIQDTTRPVTDEEKDDSKLGAGSIHCRSVCGYDDSTAKGGRVNVNTFDVNKTSTGYTVTVDGKLRGSRIPSQKEAAHLGRMLTDNDYRLAYERIQRNPEQAVKDLQEFRRLKSPSYYARQAGQARYYLRGHTIPRKGVGLEESPMTWEGAEARWGEAWKSELYRYIGGLQRELRKVEDTEALLLLRKMARALTLEDRETYYENLDKLMEWYGEMW